MGVPFTGRAEMRSSDKSVRMETIVTADAMYVRDLSDPGKAWMKGPRTAESAQGDYTEYAKLLLAQGPAARKGMETRDGVPVFHLAGHLDIEQIAEIDPRAYRSYKSKGVTGFDLDQWIDAQGRTIYFEQRLPMRGHQGTNKVTFSDFGPPETFAAPTAG
ncbi:hypothetical protein ACWEQL_07945 [Kitasatospora sp. NPDC004240]